MFGEDKEGVSSDSSEHLVSTSCWLMIQSFVNVFSAGIKVTLRLIWYDLCVLQTLEYQLCIMWRLVILTYTRS